MSSKRKKHTVPKNDGHSCPQVRAYQLLKPTVDRNKGEYTQDLFKIFCYLVNQLSKANTRRASEIK